MKLKQISVMFIVPLLIFGCSKKHENSSKHLSVVASFYPVYIIAKNVAAGITGVSVTNMTPPITGCLHDYSITADDMKALEKADLFLVNGAGMESFLMDVAGKYPKLKTCALSENIPLIKNGTEVNPHLWVSVANAIIMTENCARDLAANDPENKSRYSDNSEKYILKLKALKSDIDRSKETFKGQKIVTFHEAFPYFAQEYGLEITAVIEREPGAAPSAKELAETIDIVKKSNIKALFAEPQYPAHSAKLIAKETGAKVFILDPAVTGPDNPDAYIDIMKSNFEVLKKAFK